MKKHIFRPFLPLCLAMCLLLTAALFAACQAIPATEDEPAPENDEPAQKEEETVYSLSNLVDNVLDYTLIRADAADKTIKDAYIIVRDAIRARTGEMPVLETDYLQKGTEADPGKLEILIGDTNREETATAKKGLKDGEYAIKQVGNKICVVGTDVSSTVRAVNAFVSTFFGYTVQEKTFHNVVDYGAVGDGKNDDTKAFQCAIEAAADDGLPVYVPYGTYLITETLVLDSVTLYGYNTGAWTADNCDLPVVIHQNVKEPLFDVVSGSVSGLHIEVKGVNQDTKDAAETIRITDTGGRVSNMTIRNPYIAISTVYGEDFPGNPGRCLIENIFIVQAWYIGVRVYGTYDVATMCNIEVWNNDISHSCPVGFKFGHNDDIRAVNLFAFNANVGFLFEETPTGNGDEMGSCWGSFNNCSVDYTSIGVQVAAGTHHLTFVGGTYWTHHRGLYVTKENEGAQVAISGCELKSNGSETVTIDGGSLITITGSNIVRTMNGYANPCVSVTGGKAVTISGNTLACAGINISFSPAFSGVASVVGNTLLSSGRTFTRSITGTKGTVVYEANAELGAQSFE